MKRSDRIPCQDGDEYDFLGWCKKFFKFRPGERKKRKYNKRRRKGAKTVLRPVIQDFAVRDPDDPVEFDEHGCVKHPTIKFVEVDKEVTDGTQDY